MKEHNVISTLCEPCIYTVSFFEEQNVEYVPLKHHVSAHKIAIDVPNDRIESRLGLQRQYSFHSSQRKAEG